MPQTDNYIRIGNFKDMEFVFFNGRDPESVAWAKNRFQELLRLKGGSAPVALWKAHQGFNCPLVGINKRSSGSFAGLEL